METTHIYANKTDKNIKVIVEATNHDGMDILNHFVADVHEWFEVSTTEQEDNYNLAVELYKEAETKKQKMFYWGMLNGYQEAYDIPMDKLLKDIGFGKHEVEE